MELRLTNRQACRSPLSRCVPPPWVIMKTTACSGLLLAFLALFGAAPARAQTTSTTTLLTTSVEPACLGQPVTLTAVVTNSPTGLGTPTGSVDFWDGGGGHLGSATLDANGQATLTIDSLTAGSYSLTAQYSGDATFAASTSSAITGTINTAPAMTGNPLNQSV